MVRLGFQVVALLQGVGDLLADRTSPGAMGLCHASPSLPGLLMMRCAY
jgi:hypothetical protein